jgi:hypothetical protein
VGKMSISRWSKACPMFRNRASVLDGSMKVRGGVEAA